MVLFHVSQYPPPLRFCYAHLEFCTFQILTFRPLMAVSLDAKVPSCGIPSAPPCLYLPLYDAHYILTYDQAFGDHL